MAAENSKWRMLVFKNQRIWTNFGVQEFLESPIIYQRLDTVGMCWFSNKISTILNFQPPYWICHFEVTKYKDIFRINVPKISRIPKLVQIGWYSNKSIRRLIFIRHIGFAILKLENLTTYSLGRIEKQKMF